MDVAKLRESLDRSEPPQGIGPCVTALWYAAKDDWDRAHQIAQSEPGADGSWVHAYLHRVEGDEANAGYWYRRAGRPHVQAPLADEWEAIAEALLAA